MSGRGEAVMGALFGVLGAAWIVGALDLTYMGDFAPGSGFLPFWLGIALVGLSALFVWRKLRSPGEAAPAGGWRKTAAIAGGLAVCVGVIEALGFVVSVAAYLVFLTRFVEREPWRPALGVSLGTVAALFAVFRLWLSVPLPKGPWGF